MVLNVGSRLKIDLNGTRRLGGVKLKVWKVFGLYDSFGASLTACVMDEEGEC